MKQLVTLFATMAILAVCTTTLLAQEESKVMVNFGAGGTLPVRDSGPRLDPGWNVNGGLGWRFAPHFGVMGEFNFNSLPFNGTTLTDLGVPDGSTRVWGFTLNPTVRTNPWGPVDFYLIGGGGIYKRTVEFTRPSVATFTAFDPFFGIFYPVAVPTDQVIASFSTWKGGLNIGGGLTFRFGSSNAKLYVESRYHHVFTRPLGTDILPLTVGVRW
jgi:opacity protein-like surface antigen